MKSQIKLINFTESTCKRFRLEGMRSLRRVKRAVWTCCKFNRRLSCVHELMTWNIFYSAFPFSRIFIFRFLNAIWKGFFSPSSSAFRIATEQQKNRDIYDERKIIKEFLIIVNLYCNLTFVINVLEEVGVNKLFIRTMTTQLRRLSSCFKFISQKNAFH